MQWAKILEALGARRMTPEDFLEQLRDLFDRKQWLEAKRLIGRYYFGR